MIPLPAKPVPTSNAMLVRAFGDRPGSLDKVALAAAARAAMSPGVPDLFRRYVVWMRASGYSFRAFAAEMPVLDKPNVYLRYDVHLHDLMPAYILADLHQELGIPGAFQISWRLSAAESEMESYFLGLRAFTSDHVHFGLHCAPSTTWYVTARHEGDQRQAVAYSGSPGFIDYLDRLLAGYRSQGPDFPELRDLLEGADATLDELSQSFRSNFGDWPTISAHGTFLSAAYLRALKTRPELECLAPFFCAERLLRKLGVQRYGFAYEITTDLPNDDLPGSTLQVDGDDPENIRRRYATRMAAKGGFVALFHPAHWTCDRFRVLTDQSAKMEGPQPIIAAAAKPAPDNGGGKQIGASKVPPPGKMENVFGQFVEGLVQRGYTLRPLEHQPPALDQPFAYLRYDVHPPDLPASLRLAALHQQLKVPGTFHLAWDLIANNPGFVAAARRLLEFDPQYVHIGLQCDAVAAHLIRARFAGEERRCTEFLRSADFSVYLTEMLAALRSDGASAAALQAVHEGARDRLVAINTSFREAFPTASSISGRGAGAFYNACQEKPELAALAPWFNPIDFLANLDLRDLGYSFEATRFPPDGRPGPTVVYGSAEVSRLRGWLQTRMTAGGGFVFIFAARSWDDERYEDLLTEPEAIAGTSVPASLSPRVAPFPGTLPAQPVLTAPADLALLGTRCELVDTQQLAVVARRKVGIGIDASFTRFVDWLRSEGYSFGGFEDGVIRFDERWAYLRYDVHVQDLLAAYVLADIHQRLGIIGSFQITWKLSPYERALEPYFTKLLEFDRRYVQFGLHVAPAATWFLDEKHGGDYAKANKAVGSEDFVAWLRELHAIHATDGDGAPALREVREGADDALARIAASFRATFGVWKSISGHGNFLTNGFNRARQKHPELSALAPYFHPVEYMRKWGPSRFGFDYELTAFGSDERGLPLVFMEGSAEELRRQWYRGRVARGGGFVALLHPASWTCRHNAAFFLPAESEDQQGSQMAKKAALPPRLEAAIEKLQVIVREAWAARGEDPDSQSIAANIAYNSVDCRRRAGALSAYLDRAYGFSVRGKAVGELGCGFGGLCLHWALEHGANRILAVDHAPLHVDALRGIVGGTGIEGFSVIEGDLQAVTGHDETMDLVVLNDVLYLAVLAPDRVAAVCARLLRPGGVVLFQNVNRAYGPSVATHRDGTQFLDPDSADRAARFAQRGSGSTLGHRPLSPWGLAAFLREAGFCDFRLYGDMDGVYEGPPQRQALGGRYLLAGRKSGAGPRPFKRMASAADSLDDAPYCDAADRVSAAIATGAARLQVVFGTSLSNDTAYAELRGYVIDRLLMDGLASFRDGTGDSLPTAFAKAVDDALDHSLAAVLTRHADWSAAEFATADADGFKQILDDCVGAARQDFRQPVDAEWLATADWGGLAQRLAQTLVPDSPADDRVYDRLAHRLRTLFGDRMRLKAVGLLARTADPLTGSLEAEYSEAAIDRIACEFWSSLGPAARGPRPVCPEGLIDLVETTEADWRAARRPRRFHIRGGTSRLRVAKGDANSFDAKQRSPDPSPSRTL